MNELDLKEVDDKKGEKQITLDGKDGDWQNFCMSFSEGDTLKLKVRFDTVPMYFAQVQFGYAYRNLINYKSPGDDAYYQCNVGYFKDAVNENRAHARSWNPFNSQFVSVDQKLNSMSHDPIPLNSQFVDGALHLPGVNARLIEINTRLDQLLANI